MPILNSETEIMELTIQLEELDNQHGKIFNRLVRIIMDYKDSETTNTKKISDLENKVYELQEELQYQKLKYDDLAEPSYCKGDL